MYRPGESPVSLSTDVPSADTAKAYQDLIDNIRLSLRDFGRDRETLWRRLDEEVSAGRLSEEEVQTLRRDHDGAYSIPLARRYLDIGQAAAVTKWMRELRSFWNYNWIDRSIRGARGRGTLRLFETLRDHQGAIEGATLAADHLWYRLIGARYHEGLRQIMRSWYQHGDYDARRQTIFDHRSQYRKPHSTEIVLEWLEYICDSFRPFIHAGDNLAISRLKRVEGEVLKERQKFQKDLT